MANKTVAEKKERQEALAGRKRRRKTLFANYEAFTIDDHVWVGDRYVDEGNQKDLVTLDWESVYKEMTSPDALLKQVLEAIAAAGPAANKQPLPDLRAATALKHLRDVRTPKGRRPSPTDQKILISIAEKVFPIELGYDHDIPMTQIVRDALDRHGEFDPSEDRVRDVSNSFRAGRDHYLAIASLKKTAYEETAGRIAAALDAIEALGIKVKRPE